LVTPSAGAKAKAADILKALEAVSDEKELSAGELSNWQSKRLLGKSIVTQSSHQGESGYS
jgi:hypothetical protein